MRRGGVTRLFHRPLALDALDQADGTLAEIGGVMGDLRFAEAFDVRDPAIECFDELIEIGQHLPGFRALVILSDRHGFLGSQDAGRSAATG